MKASIDVSMRDIENLLCAAFEGGSNYWYQITETHSPKRFDYRADKNTLFPHLDFPMNAGGYVMVRSTEERQQFAEFSASALGITLTE